MKVFITGGSGFLGINLVRFLLKKNYQITSFDIVDFDYPEKSKIMALKGDIRDYQDLKNSMKGAQIIVHCAAALPSYKDQDVYTTDVLGTRNVLKAAKANKINRVVHISSTAVYGIVDKNPSFEGDALVPVGAYGKAKILAEKECEKYRSKGLLIPILRPKTFIGPERLGIFSLLYDWASSGHGFPVIGNGKNRYQLLDVSDLCEAIHLAMTLPASNINDVFNIGAKEFTTMAEDYQAVLDRAGYGKKIRCLPAGPMIFVLRVLDRLHLSPIYRWVYETASKDSFVNIDKAQKVLGFKPKYSNIDAIIRNYDWYQTNIDQFRKQTGLSHRALWKQGIFSLIKLLF